MAIDAKYICLEEPAFYELIKEVKDFIKLQNNIKEEKWITAAEAMNILKVTSRGTLQALRDTDSIEFSKLSEKHILYNRFSLYEYLEKKAQKPF